MVEYVIGEEWDDAEDLDWVRDTEEEYEYAVALEEMTWANAQADAVGCGANLTKVTIASREWLRETFGPEPEGDPLHYWAGAEQDPEAWEPAYGWEWVDGSGVPAPWIWQQRDGYTEPDDGGEGQCYPGHPSCQDYDFAELVLSNSYDPSDDGLNDLAGTELELLYGLMQRPVDAVCTGADTLINYERTYVWQFRYDTARARYMRRPLEPYSLVPIDAETEW